MTGQQQDTDHVLVPRKELEALVKCLRYEGMVGTAVLWEGYLRHRADGEPEDQQT
jgi:hypothetical protein